MKTKSLIPKLTAVITTGLAVTVSSQAQTAQSSSSAENLETLEQSTVIGEQSPENNAIKPFINTDLGLGSKLPYSIFETPRAVETVTSEQFTQRGAQNLEEAARYVPGVESSYFGLDTRQDFIRIRGLEALNYRDGLQNNFNFYNNTPTEAYAVDQVDFIKGPASILFGRGTVGGTVNTTSKIAGPNISNQLMTSYGSDDRFQLGLDYNTALNAEETLFLRVVGYYRNSDTYVDFVNDDSRFLMPSITWKPTEDTTLSLLLNLQENESKPSLQFYPYEATQIPGYTLTNERYGGEPNLDRYNTDQKSVSAIFKHKFNETYSVTSTMRYVNSSAEYVENTIVPPAVAQAFFGASPDGYYHRLLYGSDQEMDVFSGNMVLNGKYETGSVNHDVRFGVDFTRAKRDRNTLPANPGLFGLPYVYNGFLNFVDPVYGNGASTLPDLSTNLNTTEELFGIFLHDHVEIGHLIASAGVRFDHYELKSNLQNTDKQTNYSFDAGLMYQLPHGISPYYSYAESFEPQGFDSKSTTALKPKTGTQHEFGVKWMPKEDTLITASYFRIEEENRVLADPIAVIQSSSVEANGAELGIRHRYNDFYFLAGYTYLQTKNNDTAGSPALAGVPKHQASAWVTYQPEEGPLANFRSGLGVRFTGNTSDGLDLYDTPSHTTIDAMLGYKWNDMDFQLNVSNLFDRQYVQTNQTTTSYGPATTSTFLGQDRSINLQATYTF
ncbi:MAG: TonB-dependent siderophore receptor [Akkermansiaceae bacterium]